MDPRAIVAILLVCVVLVAVVSYALIRFLGNPVDTPEHVEMWMGLLSAIVAAVSVWMGGGSK